MRTDEEEWQQIGMCEADDDGCYGDEWETEETGIYVVNATYLGSEGLSLNPGSTRLSVVVEPAEEDVFAATNARTYMKAFNISFLFLLSTHPNIL